MKNAAWIVCERRGHWAAALRNDLARPTLSSIVNIRVYELRDMSELAERLGAWPDSVALLEVTRQNFAQVLDWLATDGRQFGRARYAALIDSQSVRHPSMPVTPTIDRQAVADALWEAGAAEIITSLREMRQITAFGRRHFECLARFPVPNAESLSVADWAWAALPWQEH